MALSREKKKLVVNEAESLLSSSKMTVIARYEGTTVRSLQELRSSANSSGTKYKVIKNRLFNRALESTFGRSIDTLDGMNGQLLYGFNDQDEAAPAQALASFAKTNPQIKFVGGIDSNGQLIDATDIEAIANLPSKDQLRAQLITTLIAPSSNLASVISANLTSVFNLFIARAKSLEK